MFRAEHFRPHSYRLHGIDFLESRCMLSFGPLQPGDANIDGYFDEADIIQVLKSGKYQNARPATWADGDWNGGAGGDSDNPPAGNEIFDQLDLVTAVVARKYRTGPYADVGPSLPPNLRCLLEGGSVGDGQTSTVYDIRTGELSIDPTGANKLTSILIKSETGIFIGDRPPMLDGTFDVFNSNTIFKAVFNGPTIRDIMSFGNVLPAGMPMDLFHNDLRVDGSLANISGPGRDLGNVDNVFLADIGPEIVVRIDGLTVTTNSPPINKYVDLGLAFESPYTTLEIGISANSNSDLVTASIQNGWLGLSFASDSSGTASITVLATSSSVWPLGSCEGWPRTVAQTFEVTVVGPGDSNGDGRFNQLDIVQVLQSNKYLTGEPASFEEGDWNRDGAFNQVDIVAALKAGTYLQGPAALTMAKDSNTQEPTTEELPADDVDALFAEIPISSVA